MALENHAINHAQLAVRVEVMEDRFDRHLSEVKQAMDKSYTRIESIKDALPLLEIKLLNAINDTKVSQGESKGKLSQVGLIIGLIITLITSVVALIK
jgi:hypothetical protein